MKELIVHFGMHKTGSSSIQKTLFDNVNNGDYFYINPGYPNSSGAIASSFLENPLDFHGNLKRGYDNKRVAKRKNRFLQQLRSSFENDVKRFIISGEDFCRLSLWGFEQFVNFVNPYVDKIVAVGYVRSPKAFMESYFQQLIKGDVQRGFSLSALYPTYRERFEKFEQILGRNNVLYLPFDKHLFRNGCVVEDFLFRFSIDIPRDRIIRVNESLSLNALKLLYIYRKYDVSLSVGPNVVSSNRYLIRLLSKIEGPKLRFSPAAVKPIIDSNQSDIEWIESRMGSGFSEFFEYTPHDISCELDLLNIESNVISRFLEISKFGLSHTDFNPQQIAVLIDIIRWKKSRKSFINDYAPLE